MSVSKQNLPCIIYCVLAAVIVLVYIILTSKTSVHAKKVFEAEKRRNKNMGVYMHVYDVSVVYGIIILLLNLLLVGSVLYLLCGANHQKLSYGIIVLVLALWITYIVVAIQSYENIDSDVRSILK